jgi:pimeloyl-ACP methyl ester carboxylesterase
VDHARAPHQLIAGSEMTTVTGAGHHTPLEQPEQVASLLTGFLGAFHRTTYGGAREMIGWDAAPERSHSPRGPLTTASAQGLATLQEVPDAATPTSRHRWVLAALTAVLLLGTACATPQDLGEKTSDERSGPGGPSTPDEPDAPGDSQLQWARCRDPLIAAAGLRCATLEVPIDPADPDGPSTELALARVPATGEPSERIGSLLFNPGGPGGSGIEALAGLTVTLPATLGERFDLVSWDPRGVAASSPVRCLDDASKDAQLEGDLSPDTPEELDRAIADQQDVREACEAGNPELVEHMSTADVAADLDRIREALGEEELNYVGFSYGTAIGATYATLFPEHVRAMVLDGSVSPSADAATENLEQAKGFETTYLQFVAACDADPQCALNGGAAAKVQSVRDQLDANPLIVETSTGPRELTRDLFDLGLATALYDTSLWGITAQAIAQLDQGGGEVMLALVDAQVGRDAEGTWDNSVDSRSMVNCLDDESRPSREEAVQLGQQVADQVPTFGDAFVTSGLACMDWPLPANPTPTPTGAGAPPILVVGTIGDPATPYLWAQQMAAALQGAVLLTYEGSGHTAFTRAGSCIDDIVAAYLVELELPAAGTTCPAQDGAVSFTGVEAILLEQLDAAGIPQDVSQCITETLVAEEGASALAVALLQQDQLEQAVMQATVSCMRGG